jgi:hypothetical protein
MVVDAERPTITINGLKNQDVSERELSHGVKIFPDLVIDARTKTEDSEMRSSSDAKVNNALKFGSVFNAVMVQIENFCFIHCFMLPVMFTLLTQSAMMAIKRISTISSFALPLVMLL